MTPARERGLTALLCAAGAGLVLLAGGRTWATVQAEGAITPLTQELTGGDLGGAVGALGWACLAGLAAVFATRGRVRAGVGALIALFGAGIGYASAAAVRRSNALAAAADQSALPDLGGDPALDVNLWWAVSVTGGVLLAVAGLVTAVRGGRWPGMSARYERAAPRTPVAGDDDPSALWKSLDRGEDPTSTGPAAPSEPAREGAARAEGAAREEDTGRPESAA